MKNNPSARHKLEEIMLSAEVISDGQILEQNGFEDRWGLNWNRPSAGRKGSTGLLRRHVNRVAQLGCSGSRSWMGRGAKLKCDQETAEDAGMPN